MSDVSVELSEMIGEGEGHPSGGGTQHLGRIICFPGHSLLLALHSPVLRTLLKVRQTSVDCWWQIGQQEPPQGGGTVAKTSASSPSTKKVSHLVEAKVPATAEARRPPLKIMVRHGQIPAAIAMLRSFYHKAHLSELAAAAVSSEPSAESPLGSPLKDQSMAPRWDEESEGSLEGASVAGGLASPPPTAAAGSAQRGVRTSNHRWERRMSIHGGWEDDEDVRLWRQQQQQLRHQAEATGFTSNSPTPAQEAALDQGLGADAQPESQSYALLPQNYPQMSPIGSIGATSRRWPESEPFPLVQLLDVIRLSDQFQADHAMQVSMMAWSKNSSIKKL